MNLFLLCLTAYIVGSTPFGLILTRLAGLGDIRSIGSGNIGATNVLRTGRKGLALATLLLDAAKGAVVVIFVRDYAHGGLFLCSIAVFLGHLYPFWLGFKGGKGVATGLGVLLALSLPVGAIACFVWLAAAFSLRWSSVAALTAFLSAPISAWVEGNRPLAVLSLILGALVWWRHRGNIARLRAGTEPRIGAEKTVPTPPA
jgi:glycerol-3-phosphate acyltransferase PlsY